MYIYVCMYNIRCRQRHSLAHTPLMNVFHCIQGVIQKWTADFNPRSNDCGLAVRNWTGGGERGRERVVIWNWNEWPFPGGRWVENDRRIVVHTGVSRGPHATVSSLPLPTPTSPPFAKIIRAPRSSRLPGNGRFRPGHCVTVANPKKDSRTFPTPLPGLLFSTPTPSTPSPVDFLLSLRNAQIRVEKWPCGWLSSEELRRKYDNEPNAWKGCD